MKHYTAINTNVIDADSDLDPLESKLKGEAVYLLPRGATFDHKEAEALAAEQLAVIEAAKPPPPPEPTLAELQAAALAQVRAIRGNAFSKLDYMSIDALTDENLDLAKQIKVTKLALRDITKVDVSKCKSAAEIANAYKAAWATVAAAAPDAVKKLFDEALL